MEKNMETTINQDLGLKVLWFWGSDFGILGFRI